MATFFQLTEKLKKSKDDPCWDGYAQRGTKQKGGEEVPNCVPQEGTVNETGYIVVQRGPGFEIRKDVQTGKKTRVWTEGKIEEKAVSQAQQKMMGAALAYKRGENPDAPQSVKDLAKSMSTKDLEDFASTKHKGLPAKKESVEMQEMDLSKHDSKKLLQFYRKYADKKMGPSDANMVKAVRRELMKRGVSIKEEVELDEADMQNKYTAAEIRKRRKLPDTENRGTARGERMRRKAADKKMGSLKKEEVELDEAKGHPAADEIHAYATKSGGMDKAYFQKAAGHINSYRQSGNHSALVKHIKSGDTDARDKVMSVLMKHDKALAKSVARKAGLSEAAGSWQQDSGWKKAQKIYKDRYGNVVKKQNVAKHLAKKAQQKTAAQK